MNEKAAEQSKHMLPRPSAPVLQAQPVLPAKGALALVLALLLLPAWPSDVTAPRQRWFACQGHLATAAKLPAGRLGRSGAPGRATYTATPRPAAQQTGSAARAGGAQWQLASRCLRPRIAHAAAVQAGGAALQGLHGGWRVGVDECAIVEEMRAGTRLWVDVQHPILAKLHPAPAGSTPLWPECRRRLVSCGSWPRPAAAVASR